MKEKYPHLSKDVGMSLNFKDKISFRGGECKPQMQIQRKIKEMFKIRLKKLNEWCTNYIKGKDTKIDLKSSLVMLVKKYKIDITREFHKKF